MTSRSYLNSDTFFSTSAGLDIAIPRYRPPPSTRSTGAAPYAAATPSATPAWATSRSPQTLPLSPPSQMALPAQRSPHAFDSQWEMSPSPHHPASGHISPDVMPSVSTSVSPPASISRSPASEASTLSLFASSSRIAPTTPEGRYSPVPPEHCSEPQSPSVASLVDMSVHTPSRTDLLRELRLPSPSFSSPAMRQNNLPTQLEAVNMRRRGHAGGLRPLSLLADGPRPPSLLAGGPRPPSLLAGGPRPPSLLTGSPLTASELALPMARSSTPIDVIQDSETRTSEQESPAADKSKSARTRHSTFYMRDEMVVLDVDGCLYRVHRHILEHNSDFLRRLMASYANEDGVSGGTDDTAIPLPDIKPYQLDCLLHFLYYRVYDDNDDIPLADWATLLDVATRLGFSAVRARAIRALAVRRDALGAVETVVLALAHGVPAWLASAYAALVRRPRPLDDTEADRLGARITVRLAAAREAVRAAHWPPGDECAFDEEVVAKAVANAFWGGARGEDAGCDGIRQEGVKLRASVAVASLGLGET